MSSYVFKSLIGNIEIISGNNKITSISRTRKAITKTKDKLLLRAAFQINAYLARRRRSLSFPTRQMGTKFQNRVWNHLRQVPYGRTTSYGQIAKKLKTSPRAVGRALGRNNLMMTVPCHRVIGKNGELIGFTSVGGISTKKRLLKLEKNNK
ncbi:methylated-DNA--[protein]-cysteine S-methyltransferase [Pelagibacteraceae bacterium]|nr:methylated-DNA--[protein]-cysteine S-methyltransferase [Pelagibacteraceae bacterium]